MKASILVALLMTLSTQVFGGPIQQELRRKQFLEGYFGITGNVTKVPENSWCSVVSREEKGYADAEANTEDAKANKLLHHVQYFDCVMASIFTGVKYYGEEVERKYCDTAWFNKETSELIAKIKETSSPKSGQYAGKDPNRFINTVNFSIEQHQRYCELYVARNGKPKPALVQKENVPVNANDSARANIKEKEYSDALKKNESVNTQK